MHFRTLMNVDDINFTFQEKLKKSTKPCERWT